MIIERRAAAKLTPQRGWFFILRRVLKEKMSFD